MRYVGREHLYRSHGYILRARPLQRRGSHRENACYPVNLGIVQAAQGVIAHWNMLGCLPVKWLGPGFADDWIVIPAIMGRP